ncbi:cell division protein FtsL [Cohnella lupini]|uniref:Cell division protein FtsL n=1 Tax=Cohnella lupini TaxID=1294267 RepID=A0A3D9IVN2_9BACL|nr:cell division protein FtsL [Cohnella lupini]RED65772.1 cell division protein FtsL [Cohnella lupini]
MAYYGNLALRPERVQEETVQPKRTQPNPTGKTKVNRRRSISIGEKLLYLFTVGVVVFVAGFIIFRYAQIYQINGQIQAKNKTYEQATEETKELKHAIESLSDPQRIKEKAIENGLVPTTSTDKIIVNSNSSKFDRNAVAIKQP